MKKLSIALCVVLSALLFLAGCDSDSEGKDSNKSAGGSVTVEI